jgi:hypothetical protein
MQIKMPDVDGYTPSVWQHWGYFNPSTNWAQGGPIIEREKIKLDQFPLDWEATLGNKSIRKPHYGISVGETPLISAMRCYVKSKLGNSIQIPKELFK